MAACRVGEQDVILGLGFLALTMATLRRLRACAGQAGLQTVIMTFYSLILFTSLIRAVWFLIPTSVGSLVEAMCVLVWPVPPRVSCVSAVVFDVARGV